MTRPSLDPLSTVEDDQLNNEWVCKCLFGCFFAAVWLNAVHYCHCLAMLRDLPNSRFHGRDIFHLIGLLPWKMLISMKSVIFVNFNAFTFIYEGFRVLSAAFVWILLFAMCHTWAHDCLESWLSIYICSKCSLFINFKCTIWQIS